MLVESKIRLAVEERPRRSIFMMVFLGSSKEKSSLMTEIAVWVGRYGHTPIRWSDPEAFPAGTVTLSRLLELTSMVDAAVFVFSDDDKTWYRGRKISSPRDNVIFEYGLFLGKLGFGRATIVREGDSVGPSDLDGLNLSDLDGLNLIIYTKDNPIDAEDRFRHWIDRISTGLAGSTEPAAIELPDDAPIYRMLLVINFLGRVCKL
jgi:predicted nucleotide-binding protein